MPCLPSLVRLLLRRRVPAHGQSSFEHYWAPNIAGEIDLQAHTASIGAFARQVHAARADCMYRLHSVAIAGQTSECVPLTNRKIATVKPCFQWALA